MSNVIQCLWIGDSLSRLEQLSIRSFLANGHEVHLYLYEQLEGVPRGTRVMNAERVLPRSAQFVYRDYPSYAGFANFFRYRLLLETGGWWVDLDTICLRPFDFASDYVFSSEDVLGGDTKPNIGAIKVPAHCDLMAELWRRCEAFDVGKLAWGECGPNLLAQAVRRHGLEDFVQPPQAFCPVPWWEWRNVLEPGPACTLPKGACAIHLWNEMWRRAGIDKSAQPPPGSLYAQLQERFPVTAQLSTGRSYLGWRRNWGTLKSYSRAHLVLQERGEPQHQPAITEPATAAASIDAAERQRSMKISAVVLTKNGEQRIERCLRSIIDSGFADEIVVCIDRATTDKSYQAARLLADHVHFVATDGYLESALPQMVALCSGDFILRLDDDERLGGNWTRPDLESLVALNDLTHLTVLRRWIVDDGESFIASLPWFPDLQMRLFRNIPASIRWPRQIHEPMEIAGNCLTPGDRWIEHDVLYTATTAERQEKCRTYQALRPHCNLSHYYFPDNCGVARLPATQQGFRTAMRNLSAKNSSTLPPPFPCCEIGQEIRFQAGQLGSRHTLSGWSAAEAWGTWTDARWAALQFYFRDKPAKPLLLVAVARAYICASHPAQSVSVECQGQTLALWTFDADEFEQKSVVVPPSSFNHSGSLTLQFHLLNPASPDELGESDDLRLLGMGLRSLRFENCSVLADETESDPAHPVAAEVY